MTSAWYSVLLLSRDEVIGALRKRFRASRVSAEKSSPLLIGSVITARDGAMSAARSDATAAVFFMLKIMARLPVLAVGARG